jgi:hypothetical protein
MNILHLYKDYFPVLGGIENHLKVLAENLATPEHRVSMKTSTPNQKNKIGRSKFTKSERLGYNIELKRFGENTHQVIITILKR